MEMFDRNRDSESAFIRKGFGEETHSNRLTGDSVGPRRVLETGPHVQPGQAAGGPIGTQCGAGALGLRTCLYLSLFLRLPWCPRICKDWLIWDDPIDWAHMPPLSTLRPHYISRSTTMWLNLRGRWHSWSSKEEKKGKCFAILFDTRNTGTISSSTGIKIMELSFTEGWV